MRILVAGDFCDCSRVSTCIKNHEYPRMFESIKPIVQSADYSIVNFEFPIVKSIGKPIKKCGPSLKGQTDAIEAISYAGFNICTLANNHILDQGEECCLETKSLLEQAGFMTVGVGKDIKDSGSILYLTKDDLRVAIINCSEHEFSFATENSAGANPICPIRQYYQIKEAKNNADFVMVISHGGHEHFNLPSLRMKELFHFYIDVGADVVINHHQHCTSGFELYQGKSIFYGIGNLLFDNPAFQNTFWNKGYMVELVFENRNLDFKTIPYVQCDNDISVTLLNSTQSLSFYHEINELNRIIENDNLLKSKLDAFYSENIENELDILEPYRGKLLNKLLSLGLMPHLIRGSKLTSILNHVNCESHREKLVYALTNRIK